MDELLADAVQHVGDVEDLLLAADPGVEHHVQQQVAQLLLHPVQVTLQDGIAQFVGLLDGERTQGLHGLLAIPGALFAKLVHDGEQAQEGFGTGVHAAKVVIVGRPASVAIFE